MKPLIGITCKYSYDGNFAVEHGIGVQVFHKEIYAVASAIGALAFYGLQMVMPDGQALYPAFFITVAIRLVSVRYDINLPQVRGGALFSNRNPGKLNLVYIRKSSLQSRRKKL